MMATGGGGEEGRGEKGGERKGEKETRRGEGEGRL
jgi:hypothetical protein